MRDDQDHSGAGRGAKTARRPHPASIAVPGVDNTAGAAHPLVSEEALAQLGAALDEMGRSLLVCDGEGRVLYHTPGAAPLLDWLMVRGGGGPGRLPASTRAWFASQVAAMRATNGRHVAPEWDGEAEGFRLRLVGADVVAGRFRLTLERALPHREQIIWLARRLEITRREAQVLLWACAGKTNPEIAIILTVERSTVRKHLEHVFARIGVENRLAAAALVSRLGPPV